ncbi:cytochrome c oxidase subunit 6C-like [Meriones unguiculatus]|uniref:cytochrome c oxidase subunit 6C-like n=1 Tax=Meriones unguiculatus TaxID=10047 RepID=UPI000B4FA62A|nr:cytochrome c oxidase subunit 6C-like [Meriones unguiculatus]
MTSSAWWKLQVRGLMGRHLRVHTVDAFILLAHSFWPWELQLPVRFGAAEPRKKAYADFFRNYDSVKDFEETRKAGIVQSAVISECKEFFGLSPTDVLTDLCS